MKKEMILIFSLFILGIVSGAMDPAPAYCIHQGYSAISISSAEYEDSYLEKWYYLYSGKTYVKFNDSLHEINTSRRESLEINRIVLDTESTIGEINWSERKYYCFFDEINRCDMREFYEDRCGEEYKKDISCRKEGEILFPQFEICCEGLESSFGWWNQVDGQPKCIKRLNFFQKIWRWIF